MNLLVDRSRCVWTLVILASLDGRHLGGGLQEQCQAADQEKAVFANFGHRELRGASTGLSVGLDLDNCLYCSWSLFLYPSHAWWTFFELLCDTIIWSPRCLIVTKLSLYRRHQRDMMHLRWC